MKHEKITELQNSIKVEGKAEPVITWHDIIVDGRERKDICEHLHVGPSATPGNICAVSTLENIFDKYGYDVLDRTLLLCIGTWEGAKQSLSANMLNAVARLIYVYGDTLSNERFKEKLSRVSAKEISRTARDRRNGSLGYAEALVIEYNRKSHTNLLSMSALYANKPAKRKDPIIDDEEELLEEPNIISISDAINMNSSGNIDAIMMPPSLLMKVNYNYTKAN